MNAKIKHFIFRFYGLIALLAFIGVIAWFFRSSKGREEITILLTIVGGLVSFLHFVQKQQLEELEIFKELFTEFNKRYDGLNEDLSRIFAGDPKTGLSKKDKDILNDYFNLCAEEYLFYKRGYIYQEVWTAWHKGMKEYMKNEKIKKHWEHEKLADSYYKLMIE